MSAAVLKVLGVLIPIALGLAFRHSGAFGDRDGDVLRRLVMRLTVPVLVFFAIYDASSGDIRSAPSMVVCLVLLTALLFAIGWAASHLVEGTARRTAVHACITFGNYGWLGFGVAKVFQGDVGLQRAVFFTLLWWPVFYAFGLPIGFLHGRSRGGGAHVPKALRAVAPSVAAICLGLLFNLMNWPVHGLLQNALRPFGEMTVPLILFSVGVMLDLKGAHKALAPALLVSAVTLLIAPLIGWELGAIFTSDSVSYTVVILEAAMPVAAVTPLLAESYEMDLTVANTAIVVSTLLSMVTLTLLAALLPL